MSGGKIIRVCVYIDGFNLYYGALKGSPHKWVNPVELARLVLPSSCKVEKVKYFTARASGAADPDTPRRQQTYLAALATLPELEIFYGSFLAKTAWRPLANLPIAGAAVNTAGSVVMQAGNYGVTGGTLIRPATIPVGEYPGRGANRRHVKAKRHPLPDALIVETHTMEEKGSDVNLAAHLLNDGWLDLYDAAAVISNDTDLVTPMRMVKDERQKPVFAICPHRGGMIPSALQLASTYQRHIRPGLLAKAQFPDTIPGTGITKPPGW